GHGHPGAVGAYRDVRDRCRDGGGKRRAVRPAGCGQPYHGAELGPESLHRGGGRRHGQPRRLDCGGDLPQPSRSPRPDLCGPVAGGDRVVHRADPDASVPPDRPVRAHTQMSEPVTMTEGPPAATLDAADQPARPEASTSRSHTIFFWSVFAVVVGLLIVAPLV